MPDNPSTAPSPDAMAEMERLLCNCSARSLIDPGPHTPDCALNDFGTAVASALQLLMDENRGLRDALEPFAKAAEIRLCGEWRDDQKFGMTDVGHHLTFGDLRRARTALSAKEPQS